MPATTKRPARKDQGSKWIRPDKRLAIYLRDGLSCAYCNHSVEEGARLSLDHITPYSAWGSNDADNLITCCRRCNSARGNRSVRSFVKAAAHYINVDAEGIRQYISDQTSKSLQAYRAEAKTMIARRGSCAKVLDHKRS